MKKLFPLLILSFLSVQSLAGSCPDGSEPIKSISEDGTYFVFNCGGGNKQSSSSTANSSNVNSKTKALAGIYIENDPNINFFAPPSHPPPTRVLYPGTGGYFKADFNNDGLTDLIYAGGMHAENYGCSYQDRCTLQQQDDGIKPQPALYMGGADGKFNYSPELLIDNRDNKGMSVGRQLLIADYNNDKVLDIYIADHGQTHQNQGYRDSYYLSQPNGTWLESSNTHLSDNNFIAYAHGAATGDIDNDGDMDVVLTDWRTFWCLMNDGSGFLAKRQCGGSNAFGLELADMDNDGNLDAIFGGNEYGGNGFPTGIYWNDGQGNFIPYTITRLKQHKVWGGISEVSAWDLDNDGDMDIVYGRNKKSIKGAAIQIIENLGNKKFKDHGIFPVDSNFSVFIMSILFNDLDSDGDYDLYLASKSHLTDGTVFINNGNFDFTMIKPDDRPSPKSLGLYEMLDDSSVVIPKKVLEELAAEEEAKAKSYREALAANLKRIAEKADKATENETEQSIEDEIAAFEAELEAELGQ
ncbi:FG-GAP repeat domain-containing protein [Pseudothioglobus sp. nBUS_23]|uniref:FG-GAP repeat domain-containing protein n=1 Tax=Pseudothioglobus sp. nBUS_23 TaxID=3395318 RepID=UPI003EBCF3AF